MADEVDEIHQALKHALKEDSLSYRINHSLLNFFEGSVEFFHLYAIFFLNIYNIALVEPEVVQQSDTGVKSPIGFSELSQW